ncbi:MAG: glycoside hydrolase family 2 [Clostridia bacterium]|nr:glycoside hydrolase family 2 [Clostridia bacterium]
MNHNELKTPYFDILNKEMPLSEYPRPQMKRDSYLCLNGYWDFATSRGEELPDSYQEKILVPFPPESALSGINRRHEIGEQLFYRKTFTLDKDFVRARTVLHFGAVDQIARVYFNSVLIGTHEGGYLPFSFDVTEYLRDGENVIELSVKDDLDKDYPYGKQRLDRGGMWYTEVSGIWQTVWLESLPENAVEKIKITPTCSNVKIEVMGGGDKKTLTLIESGESFEFYGSEITVTPSEIRHWSPECPYLYYFTLKSGDDEIESYFALREVGTSEKDGIPRLTLNGKPYLFNGLLDQGYFPDGIFLPADYKGYEDDILLAKSLGYNMLRKHIKLEPMIFYYLCDKLGIAVFQDMINNSDYSFIRDTALPTVGLKRLSDKHLHKNEKSRRIFRETMHEIQDTLYNTPSVVYYTVFNEGWGQFLADENYALAKAYDKTRIYDATSGWFTRHDSDVDSRHVYFKKIKLGKRGVRPIVISEFGGYSYRVDGHVFGKDNYGYKNYASKQEYGEAIRKLYHDEVKPLISRGVSALVFTQISDVEDETNGLITYDRQVVKLDKDAHFALMKELEKEI